MDHPDGLLTLEEAAVRLRVVPAPRIRRRTLAALRRLGIPTLEVAKREWRVRCADLDAAIERHFRPSLPS